MMEHLARFVIGGVVVSAFAMLGDVLRPKIFAGLFGAAPSVGLATLGLTLARHGADYVSIQAQSMAFGAIALLFYCVAVCQLLMRYRWRAAGATVVCLILWLGVAFGLQFLVKGLT